MPEPTPPTPWVEVYDTRTGTKLPHPVPQSWLTDDLHPHLSPNPSTGLTKTGTHDDAQEG